MLIRRNVLNTFESRFWRWNLVNISRLKVGQIFRLKLVHMNFGEIWSTCDITLSIICLWQQYFIKVPFPFSISESTYHLVWLGLSLTGGGRKSLAPDVQSQRVSPEWSTLAVLHFIIEVFFLTWASLNITMLAEVSRMSKAILIRLPLRYEVSLRCHQPKTVWLCRNSVGWTLSPYPPLQAETRASKQTYISTSPSFFPPTPPFPFLLLFRDCFPILIKCFLGELNIKGIGLLNHFCCVLFVAQFTTVLKYKVKD